MEATASRPLLLGTLPLTGRGRIMCGVVWCYPIVCWFCNCFLFVVVLFVLMLSVPIVRLRFLFWCFSFCASPSPPAGPPPPPIRTQLGAGLRDTRAAGNLFPVPSELKATLRTYLGNLGMVQIQNQRPSLLGWRPLLLETKKKKQGERSNIVCYYVGEHR